MVRFSFCGHDLMALPQGALFWPSRKALLVAELHLEKASWFARLGQMLPPYDSQATLSDLGAIVAATGVNPRPWFRCPFGAGTDDPRVRAGIERLGYREIFWDVDGADWRPSRRARGMARQIVADTVARGDGAIVLLHPWTTATGRGLAPLMAGLRDAGASFVRMDALG